MARTTKKKSTEALELNMTAMCDVVFQLLIYLILTAKPAIVYSNLDITRPTPPDTRHIENIDSPIEVMVFSDAYVIKGKRVQLASLGKVFDQLAEISRTQMILIKCTWDSPHERLVQCLDQCSRSGLSNLSVMSM